jgi:hypothetical protein
LKALPELGPTRVLWKDGIVPLDFSNSGAPYQGVHRKRLFPYPEPPEENKTIICLFFVNGIT